MLDKEHNYSFLHISMGELKKLVEGYILKIGYNIIVCSSVIGQA